MTTPARSKTQTCVSSIETSRPAKYSMFGLLSQRRSRFYRPPGRAAPHYPMLKNSNFGADHNSKGRGRAQEKSATGVRQKGTPLSVWSLQSIGDGDDLRRSLMARKVDILVEARFRSFSAVSSHGGHSVAFGGFLVSRHYV